MVTENKEIPQDFEAEKSLEIIIDRFTYQASQAIAVGEVSKLLSVAEKASKLLCSIEDRKAEKSSVINLVCSWIRTGIRQADLYLMYKDYCQQNGLSVWSNQTLFQAVREKGYVSVRKNDTTWIGPDGKTIGYSPGKRLTHQE